MIIQAGYPTSRMTIGSFLSAGHRLVIGLLAIAILMSIACDHDRKKSSDKHNFVE